MFLFPHYPFSFSVSIYVCRHPSVILTLSDYPHFALPKKFILCPTLFLLCTQIISDDNTIYIPCAILELSGTIPESADKVGFLLCAGTIPESYRFLLCAEHIYYLVLNHPLSDKYDLVYILLHSKSCKI